MMEKEFYETKITDKSIYMTLIRGYGFSFDYKDHHYDLIHFDADIENDPIPEPNTWLFDNGVCPPKWQLKYVEQLRYLNVGDECILDIIKSIDHDKLIVGTTFDSLMRDVSNKYQQSK